MDYILILLLLLMSAFFSAAETAFSSVNKIRLKAAAEKGEKKAARALKVAEIYDRTLTTILIGNNIVNIFSASLGSVICTRLFGDSGVVVSTIVMTVLVLIFGEIIPKSYAKENAEKLALSFGGILDLLIRLFYPISAFFMMLKDRTSRLYSHSDEPSVTEDELKYIIDEIEEEGVLEEQESDLVRSALEFDEKNVGQIIVPRVGICAVEVGSSYEKIREIFLSDGYSRIPVYEKSLDNITGIINYKDFIRMSDEEFSVEKILQKPLHFTEFLPLSAALRDMQKNKQHMAVVLDQYGGTCGIVTLEDIIEELVGEIYDESDIEEKSIVKISENEYEVTSSAALSDLLQDMDIDADIIESESNTVGGFALECFGRIPHSGEETDYAVNDTEKRTLHIRIVSSDDNHINKLMISINNDNGEALQNE